jgi:glyoxylase-like metal-dependent hydrolase (beta-lactamase superfamily II)
MSATITLILAVAESLSPAPTAAPSPQEIAPGVALLRGAILEDRGPDGNTIVFDAPEGLVVVDTGRHAWHSDAILAYAKFRKRPVAAVVNTHWHLDHASGNGRVRAAYPGVPVYATDAIDRVLADGGFLARNLESAKPMLDDPKLSETQKEEVKIFVATMDERQVLRPDVVVSKSGPATLAGQNFDVHVTDGAVTDADIWLYDPSTGVAAIGDLVTLPAPFFETACPAQWRKALDEVWSVPFKTAVPGHGEPMTRAQFDTYRGAFNAYVDCVEGPSEAGHCAAGWTSAVAPLLGSDERARRMSADYAEFYVGMLRGHGGKSADCRAP